MIIQDITELFKRDDVKFDIFKKLVKKFNSKAIITKEIQKINPEVFDNIDKWAKNKASV